MFVSVDNFFNEANILKLNICASLRKKVFVKYW